MAMPLIPLEPMPVVTTPSFSVPFGLDLYIPFAPPCCNLRPSPPLPQGLGSEVPLGRVFVRDPDDWDAGDKTWAWSGEPHPLFALNEATGQLFAAPQLTHGR